ncbi:unnamed protein product [Rotaria sordida]|uniref:Uncharacterized protein n=1 Tax=Rotaria sordida TaxID=392033 RepID=A0A814JM20_9BILA|nr:unnamed protein product [Rotaria sordida]CAF1451953.1 unnamed protein product [Rotaria sordida]
MWMDEMMRQMDNSLKRCDVSGVDLLMNNHQSLKVEIDVRQENFTICINLDEQQPLQQDVNLIDDNIKNLKIKAEEIKCSIEFGFNNLRSLQIELGTYKMKMD